MLVREYYQLTKPGIVYGNLVTAAAGFLLAAKGSVDFPLFAGLLSGTALVVASGCVFNNITDVGVDGKMNRTKNRALVTETISTNAAFLFATILGLAGFVLLYFYTNLLALSAGLVGFVFYIIVYGFWKRRTIYGTLIGSVAGATPPVAGYLAAANQFDTGSALLFLILVCWQMAHFYAIAIYRLDDYKAASIPVWPTKKGIPATKVQILIFALAFGAILPLLTFFNYTGYVYLIVMLVVFLGWLRLILQGFKVENEKNWARRVFLFSQFVIVAFATFLSLDVFLP